MALIKRTGGADFPDKLKALVTGPPKSGKTTLLGTVPNIIIADTEPRANNLASLAHLDVPYVTIDKMADLQELRMILGTDSLRQQAAASVGLPSIDAVAIDTMDSLQKIMKRERMESERTTKFLRDDWSWLKEEMTKIIEGFTSLPLHVIFTVHITSKDVGTEQNPMTRFQPGLEGAIANEIAGMVGYSLRSFRKEEMDGQGNRFTKYWLQAEGDETYDFLGTRTAGRLPAFIEPDFGEIYRAAMAGRPQPSQQQQQQQPVQTAPVAPAPQPQEQAPAPQAGPDSGPAQEPQAQPQAQEQPTAPAPQEAQAPAPQPPAERPADTEPINEAALQHVKKVYDSLGLGFPEAALRSKTLGEARQIVMMWRATQEDYAKGNGQEGSSAEEEMKTYLGGLGLLPGEGDAPPSAPSETQANLDGTIDEAKAWVGDGSDLARVQEAYNHEVAGKNRSSFVSWLESKGATPVQTDVQNTPQAPAEAVTPAEPGADDSPTKAQAEQAQNSEAVQRIEEGLGGEVVEVQPAGDVCASEEGDVHPIDDPDIAKISETRFGKRLCVNHYIAATKAS